MQLIVKTIETKENTIDVQLPFFRKKSFYSINEYLAIITPELIHCVTETDGYWVVSTISTGNESKMKVVNEAYLSHNDWEKCTEEEFLKVHADTLASLSLKPILIEANPDDLKNVL